MKTNNNLSLRDEIYNLLDQSARIDSGYYTEEIIKIIENRIEEMINNVMKKNGSEIRENGNRLEFRIIYDSQITTLKQVKEMLK